jgi:hypothetical protein
MSLIDVCSVMQSLVSRATTEYHKSLIRNWNLEVFIEIGIGK